MLYLFNDFDNLQRTLSLSASLYGLSPPSASARPTRGFSPAPTAECFSPLLPSPPTNLTVVPSRHVTHTGCLSVATDTRAREARRPIYCGRGISSGANSTSRLCGKACRKDGAGAGWGKVKERLRGEVIQEFKSHTNRGTLSPLSTFFHDLQKVNLNWAAASSSPTEKSSRVYGPQSAAAAAATVMVS